MSRWFRHYAGMMRDEKLVAVAVESGQSVERVLWVWGAILESAAEENDNGRFRFNAGEAAYFLRADRGDIDNILVVLEGMGRIGEGRVARWGDRQFTSDGSAERTRRYRDRKNNNCDTPKIDSDVTVTSRDAVVTPPETETETEVDVVISAQARDLNVLEFELRKAAGSEQNPAPDLANLSPILGLMDQGADFDSEILPAIRARPNAQARSWKYFLPQIQQYRADRKAARASPVPAARGSPPRQTGKQSMFSALVETAHEPVSASPNAKPARSHAAEGF